MGGNPIAFDFTVIIATLIPLIIFLIVITLVIYFLVSVQNFMKKKIMLDEQRIEQTNRFLELYKSTNDKR